MTAAQCNPVVQKPTPLKIKPNGIPRALRGRRQWIGWKYEWDGDKWTKPPYHISGMYKASTTNPNTWSSFEDAYAAYLDGRIDGIGYVFADNDGLVGIDLDHCLDFLSQEKKITRDEASLILLKFLDKAYIEKSVGGDGMHLIVQGKALRSGKGKGDLKFIEIYDQISPRYFTFTGHRLPKGQEEPLSAQDELNWLHESFMGDTETTVRSENRVTGKSPYDADHPAVSQEDVEVLTSWLSQVDSGLLWRKFGEVPANLDPVLADMWHEFPSASDLDMRLFGKLAWYGVLHQKISDEVIGHVMMAVYRRWPGYRGEDGERKAQYTISKALKSAFGEREKQIAEGPWKEGSGSINLSLVAPLQSIESLEASSSRPQYTKDLPPAFPDPFPGAMEEIVAFTLRTSPKPQPELALLSSLMSMSGSCSGSYYLATGSMRLNLYGLGIAETGAGKDHPRYVATEVVRKAGGRIIAKPASGQGLEDHLVSRLPMLVEVDEAAHLFQELNTREQSSATVNLNAMLLKLYSASKGTYSTRAKAANSRNPLQSMPRDIFNPTLNVLGFSTPEKLGEVLTSQNIADGMLGRMLFACGRSGVKQRRAQSEPLPSSIEQSAKRVGTATVGYGPQQPDKPCYLSEIPIKETQAATELLDAIMEEFSVKTETTEAPLSKGLFTRSFEKCYRISGVLAVWDNPKEPEINVHHVAWARKFVLASDAAALQFCDGYFHGGQMQGDGALIVKIMRKILEGQIALNEGRDRKLSADGYVTHSLVLKHSKLDKRRFDEALAYLEDAARISRATVEVPKPNGRTYKVKLLRFEEGA